MNRILEIAAMAIGGVSLFLVCFVGFVSLSGKDMSQVAVIGHLFPAPPSEEPGAEGESVAPEKNAEHGEGLSDAAVIEASLGVLSAWTLPSPYSTSELRGLSEEIKRKHAELEEHERGLARRERAVQEDEHELEERMKTMEELRTHLENMKVELDERATALARGEDAAEAGKDARWSAVAGVIGTLDDVAEAAKRLQEYQPAEAAKILRTLGDDARAGEILNALQGARWKEYVDAYTAEQARAASKRNE